MSMWWDIPDWYLKNPWKEAVIDEAVCCHIYTAEHEVDPKKALADVIGWHMKVAIDPAVSADAAELYRKASGSGLVLGLLIGSIATLMVVMLASVGHA